MILISVVISNISFAAELTKESVNQLLNTVEQAAKKHNSDAIGEVLADNVMITMNIEIQGQTQVAKVNKGQYLSMLEQGWAQVSNYDYSKSDVEIELDGDKAYITANVNESMTVQGHDVSTSSHEEAVVELVNGKVMVTNIVGYVSM